MSTLKTTNIAHPSSASNNIVLDSSGRALVGASASRTFSGFAATRFQVEGTTYGDASLSLANNENTTDGAYILLGKSRGTSLGSTTIVSNNDLLGEVRFAGADGSALRSAAGIAAYVDATPGAGDMPGRLVLSTTADGASSPTERMRISNDGELATFNGTSTHLRLQSSLSAGTTNRLIYGAHSSTGYGSGTESFRVYTNGNVQNTNNSYGSLSDIKLKENIVDAGSQWDDLKAIQVRKYNFKAETNQQTHTQLGVIAQEVELVSPGLVTESPDRDKDGNDLGTVTKSVNYSVLYMKAVKALQEAMERIEQLESEMAAVKAQLS